MEVFEAVSSSSVEFPCESSRFLDENLPKIISSESTKLSKQTLNCTFCPNTIILEGINTPNSNIDLSSTLLNNFFKILRINPATLFQGTSFEETNFVPFHCSTCYEIINNGIKILGEIEKLKGRLKDILGILKRNLKTSYDEIQSLKDKGDTPDHLTTTAFFRKTLVQCWSGCKIDLFRYEPTTFRKRRTSEKKTEMNPREPVISSSNNNVLIENQDTTSSDINLESEMTQSPSESNNNNKKNMNRRDRKRKRISLISSPSVEPKLDDNPFKISSKTIIANSQTQDFPFECETCGKGYAQKRYFNLHRRSHSEIKTLSCEHCPTKFTSQKSFRKHLIDTHGAQSMCGKSNKKLDWFICQHCQHKFISMDFVGSDGRFQIPATTGSDDPPESFDDFRLLRKYHIANCEAKPPENRHCEACGKEFASGKLLEAHRTVFHTKEFPFYCDKCGVGKVNQSALSKHMLVHSSAKNFGCQICSRSFKRNVQLKFHMMRHNNEFPFMCDLCGKRFTDKQKLQRHNETHREDKQYPCPQCNKLFVSKSYVYRHIWESHKKARQLRVPSTTNADNKNSIIIPTGQSVSHEININNAPGADEEFIQVPPYQHQSSTII